MILSFKHKGLERLYTTGSTKGVQPIHAVRLRELLTALNVARGPQDSLARHGACMGSVVTGLAFTP